MNYSITKQHKAKNLQQTTASPHKTRQKTTVNCTFTTQDKQKKTTMKYGVTTRETRKKKLQQTTTSPHQTGKKLSPTIAPPHETKQKMTANYGVATRDKQKNYSKLQCHPAGTIHYSPAGDTGRRHTGYNAAQQRESVEPAASYAYAAGRCRGSLIPQSTCTLRMTLEERKPEPTLINMDDA